MNDTQTVTPRVSVLDYLRFAAAMAVVCFHLFFSGIADGNVDSVALVPWLASWSKYGYLGVDLFFMISGYVICLSAMRHTPASYAVARAVRIYPLFAVAVLITTAVASVWGGELFAVSTRQMFANLTIMPHWFGERRVDVVYWTLVLEVKFYLLMFALLWLLGASRMAGVLRLWPWAILLTLILDTKLVFLSQYYEYFAAGALFALLRKRSDPAAFAGILVCYGISMHWAMVKSANFSAAFGHEFSVAITLTLISCFYLGFAAMVHPGTPRLRLPAARGLGDLTYPIYLLHAHIGFMLLNRFATPEYQLLCYALLIAGLLMLSALAHALIEKRMAALWRRLFDALFGKLLRKLEPLRPAWARSQRP